MLDPAGELHDLEAPANLYPRVGKDLAVLPNDQTCQLIRSGGDQFSKAKQDLVLREIEVKRQDSKALAADLTAAVTSASPASGTRA